MVTDRFFAHGNSRVAHHGHDHDNQMAEVVRATAELAIVYTPSSDYNRLIESIRLQSRIMSQVGTYQCRGVYLL